MKTERKISLLFFMSMLLLSATVISCSSRCNDCDEGDKDCHDIYVPDDINYSGDNLLDHNFTNEGTPPSTASDWEILDASLINKKMRCKLAIPKGYDILEENPTLSSDDKTLTIPVCECSSELGHEKYLGIELEFDRSTPLIITVYVKSGCGSILNGEGHSIRTRLEPS